MPTLPILILTHGGDVKSGKLTVAEGATTCTTADIQKYLKKKTAPSSLGTYPWKGNTLHLIGYTEGKAGTENKHELPPPLESVLAFGDILVLLAKDKRTAIGQKLIPMKTEEYEAFYTQMFEGFESLGEEDSEDEEEETDEVDEDAVDDADEVDVEDAEVADEEVESEEEGEEGDEGDDEEIAEDAGGDEVEEEVVIPVKKRSAKVPKTKVPAPPKPEKVPIKKKTTMSLHFHAQGEELVPETTVSDVSAFPQRKRVLAAIQSVLATEITAQQAQELEHAIFNASLTVSDRKHIVKMWTQPLFEKIYTSVARMVVGNLSPETYIQNKGLYERFKTGGLSLNDIASLGFSDLFPEIWKDLSIRQFEREKRLLEGNKSMATDQFFCTRCFKRECTYYELQTRSADEPMTIFIQCVNCGKHWRQ
jgi:DNA-directed RNA polymerase subunit M/transcription elongation factor TFIIS